MTDRPFHSKFLSESDTPLDLQVRQDVARARKLESEALAAGLAGAWRGLSHGIRASARSLVRQYRQAETRRALAACSDQTLADIGIPREHIHPPAEGIDVRDPIAIDQAALWPRLVASLGRMRQRRRHQLRVYHELMAYSDRELDEIGLRRSDIPAIAGTA